MTRITIALAVLTTVFLGLACGSDAKNTYDPKRANDLAHAILLKPADLPGSGWTTIEDDKFQSADDIPDSANCTSVKAFNKASETDVAGKAERQIQVKARNNSEPGLTVQIRVSIYNKADRLPDVLKQYRTTVNDGTTQKCLLDVIKATLPTTVEISLNQGAAKVAAPSGGVGFGFDVEAKSDTESATLREEHFAWLKSNAAVSLDIQGPPDLVTLDLVKAAMQKTQASLDAAAKSK